MPRVLTTCPETGQTVATHAVLTPARFARVNGVLHFYCQACHHPHTVERDKLWLEEPAGPARARRRTSLSRS